MTSISNDVAVPKKSGGTYQATVLEYMTDKGPRNTRIASFMLSKNEKLQKSISSLEVGSEATLSFDKNSSNFWDLVAVNGEGEAVQTSAPTTSKATVRTMPAPKDDYALGMQVGNALNNATLLLSHGILEDTLENVARDVLRVGMMLKNQLAEGSIVPMAVSANTTEPTTNSDLSVTVDDDDIDLE